MNLETALSILLMGACIFFGGCGSHPAPIPTVQTAGPSGVIQPDSFVPASLKVCAIPIFGSFTNLGNGDTVQVSDDHGDCAITIHCGGGQITGHVTEATGTDANWGNLTLYADLSLGTAPLMACGFVPTTVNLNGINYFKQAMSLSLFNSMWIGYITPGEVNASSGNTWSHQ